MQAYDAVALKTDVQVGGSDQLFNIITAGRKLQEAMGQRPQIGIILGILPGTDGVVKMSKSLGNHIPILAAPEDMYGKVMSIPDRALIRYFELATRYTPAMIEDVKRRLADGVNPRDVKMELAREIVGIFHGPQAAEQAEAHFVSVFQKKELPDAMPEFGVSDGMNIVDVMVALKFAASKGEARRLITGGGVYLDGRTVSDASEIPAPPQILQVGKRRFAKLVKA